MEFKDRLKSERIRLKLTQKQLAEKIGVTDRTIQNYERGVKNTARFEHVHALAGVFGISTSELTGETSSPKDDSMTMERLVGQVKALFAGGELSEADKEAALLEITEAYFQAKRKR
ncbi:MAG: helix-turn-helix domain-containing protein [Ruminococcus sp.]|jgi:transcriptional regulator with XRE-family HTH domain|nr:helix-turn-helix domain-containing protein [Ruminococcus sp.]